MLVPVTGDSAWLSPLALTAAVLLVGGALAGGVRARGSLPARADVDVLGVLLLGGALAGVVLTFAGAETTRSVVDDRWPLYLSVGARRRARVRRPAAPVPGRRWYRAALLRPRGARAAVAANALVGVALVAVVVDVPVFARVTRFPTSQLGAALVLLEFLAALPVGALAGGWLIGRPCGLRGVGCRREPWPGVASRSPPSRSRATLRWDARALYGAPAQLLLVAAGLGFGLAVAPLNAVLLAVTEAPAHGIASALAVLARTMGMLVGLSVLTAVGLRVFEARQAGIATPFTLCPSSPEVVPGVRTGHAGLRGR